MNTMQGSPQVRAACASDRGRVRQINQDSYLIDLAQNLFIVSDGLGGHLAGEVASRTVVNVLPELIKHRLAALASARNRIIELTLREVILELSQRLRAESTGKPGWQGMGATLVMVLIRPDLRTAHLAHLGDSRIYLFRRGKLSQLTEDHSITALLIKHGEITEEEGREHPARGRLSRYVGMEGEVYPDVQTMELQDGDQFLLCSDGLTSMVPDDQIVELLRTCAIPEGACQALVDAANAASGQDNITTMVVNWKRPDPK